MPNVCIYEESDYINLISVKGLLDSSGIITFIPDENIGGIFSGGIPGFQRQQIFIPEDQADEALEILKAHFFIDDNQAIDDYDPETNEIFSDQPQTVILNGEEITQAEVCPVCGSENISKKTPPGILQFLLLGPFTAFLPTDSPKKKCKTCRHQWL